MTSRLTWALALVTALVIAAPAFAQIHERMEAVPWGAEVAPSEAAAKAAEEKAAFIAQYDDGEVDVYYTTADTTPTYELAMLFDGVGGADVTLGSVDVCMRQSGADGKIRYEVVVWAANGVGGTPGTEIANVAALATGVGSSPVFDSTTLDLPLDGFSDIYIGIRYHPVVDPDYSFCVDRDGVGGAVQSAYRRSNEAGGWTDVVTAFGDPGYNAMMFRASLSTPGVFADRLLVPAFAVDTTSGVGTTTLFAVRNLTDDPISVDVSYFEVDGTLQRSDSVALGPRDTQTVNVRDVPGLAVGFDDFARGYIELTTAGDPDMPVFSGDFLQVDVDGAFATGEQAVRGVDLCDVGSIRFFDFGAGTRLAVWIDNPRGPSAGIDPVSFTVQVYDETGDAIGGPQPVWTENHVIELDADDFTAETFGTLVFDFSASGGGTVFGEYSASGVFSVGFGSQCEEP